MIALFAELPALPLHTAGKYVAAAYIVFMLVIVIYVAIMAVRLTHSQQEILELHRELEEKLEEQDRAGAQAQGSGMIAATSEPAEPETVA